MPPATVAAVIAAAEAEWGLTDDVEITLEANPNSVEVANFADLAAAGVNRVSIGVQSFDSEVLEFLGRAHSEDEARRAIGTAQEHFARVSFDLIYARPGQTMAAWESELAGALAFGTDHLSLYQLTIEPGTRFATLAAKGDLTIPDGDAAADLFDATQAMTAATTSLTGATPIMRGSVPARMGGDWGRRPSATRSPRISSRRWRAMGMG
jgi:oxygen-independent coproporphyrinogen-3 oxidase